MFSKTILFQVSAAAKEKTAKEKAAKERADKEKADKEKAMKAPQPPAVLTTTSVARTRLDSPPLFIHATSHPKTPPRMKRPDTPPARVLPPAMVVPSHQGKCM